MQHMSDTGDDDQLKFALHVTYHQFFIQPVCPGKYEQSCGSSSKETAG
jgi:hypothetical protein